MKIDLAQISFIDERLREIALAIEDRFGRQTITSLYRLGDKGVHGTLPLRGIDLREQGINNAKEIERFVNDLWEYDWQRQDMNCCIYHDTGQGLHLHLQVHPNTRKRYNVSSVG